MTESAGEDSSDDNVSIDISVANPTVKAGAKNSLVVLFSPKKGLHVVTDPPMEIELDTLQEIFRMSKLQIQKDKKGYVASNKPVRQHFRIRSGTSPGVYLLKGEFIYYYCSEKEGWCTRAKQRIDIPITITK